MDTLSIKDLVSEAALKVKEAEAAELTKMVNEEDARLRESGYTEERIAQHRRNKDEEHKKERNHSWNQSDGRRFLIGVGLNTRMKLDESPAALVDARFLVALSDSGGKLCRRQELPPSVFIPLSDLEYMQPGAGGCLPIVVVSHPWLQPDHPDPRGDNLRLLATFLRTLLNEPRGDPRHGRWRKSRNTYAVFLDFVSLHQKAGLSQRTEREWRLFSTALERLSLWYSHPKTLVCKITHLPAGYPNGFDFPSGIVANTAAPTERGWCFTEASMASLVKDYDHALDLSKLVKDSDHAVDLSKLAGEVQSLGAIIKQCNAERPPPLRPDKFEAAIANKQFTSRSCDLPTVTKLYADAFAHHLHEAEQLVYTGLLWTDAQVETLCEVITSGACKRLTRLFLGGNRIGNAGALALAQAFRVSAGRGVRIDQLHLKDNRIGEEGMLALAKAVDDGVLLGASGDWQGRGNPGSDDPVLRAIHGQEERWRLAQEEKRRAVMEQAEKEERAKRAEREEREERARREQDEKQRVEDEYRAARDQAQPSWDAWWRRQGWSVPHDRPHGPHGCPQSQLVSDQASRNALAEQMPHLAEQMARADGHWGLTSLWPEIVQARKARERAGKKA